MNTPRLQHQCLHCGGWYLFEASARRCRERAIPAVQAASAAKHEAWARSRSERAKVLGLPTEAGARGPAPVRPKMRISAP